MSEEHDRNKLGRLALKKRAVPVVSPSARSATPSQFDRSFDETFGIGTGFDEPDGMPVAAKPSRVVAPPSAASELDIEVDVGPMAPEEEPPPAAADPEAARQTDPASLLVSLALGAGIPGIDLDKVVIDLANMDFLPREVAIRHGILPVSATDDRIILAMADPSQRRVVDEIEFVTGRQVVPLIAARSQIRRLLDACYKAKLAGERTVRGPAAGPGVLAGSFEHAIARPAGMHGAGSLPGTLDVSAGLDGGLAASIDLAGTPFAGASRVRPAASARKRVLVVDDEDDIRMLIVKVLRDAGLEVLEAAKGTDALRMVQTSKPDLLVLDAMLPEIHGFDVCRRIKRSQKYRHIPVIMISAIYRGWRFAHDLKASYGVDHFMEKPFKINDLVDRVTQHLSGSPPRDPAKEQELSDEAQRELEAGVDRYRAGDVDGAIGRLRRGVDIDPLSSKLHYHLGVLYGKQGNVYLAIQEMESAMEIEPSDYPTLRGLAQLYEHAGFRFKAIEMWERSLSVCPEEASRSSIKEHLVKLL